MITKIKDIVKMNENMFPYISSLHSNDRRNKIFQKSSFGPSFQKILYNQLKTLLPQGYTFNIKKHGEKNTLSITDIAGKEYIFRIEDEMSIDKIKKLISTKIKLNENVDDNLILDENDEIVQQSPNVCYTPHTDKEEKKNESIDFVFPEPVEEKKIRKFKKVIKK